MDTGIIPREHIGQDMDSVRLLDKKLDLEKNVARVLP
jgi:hypothetical protein